jgi:co-chaperonin GroES (HSP10)
MRIRPTGFTILVEVEARDKTFQGSSIVMPGGTSEREFGGREVGKIIEFGPVCFKGFEGCDGHEDWGCKVGDTVEFNRYDGKKPALAEIDESLSNFRLINDSDIKAVLEDE